MAAFDRIKLQNYKITAKLQCWCLFLVKLQTQACKNTFFYRTPPVTASEQIQEISVVHLTKGFLGYSA